LIVSAFLWSILYAISIKAADNTSQISKNDDRGKQTNIPVKQSIAQKTGSKFVSQNVAVVDSEYLFENNLSDESNQYAITLNGEESYEQSNTGMGLNLPGKRWVDLPLQLSQDLQRDDSFFISVDFMIPNMGIDESTRVILSNKTWDYSEPGFKITAFNEKTEWQPEGMLYVDFNIGVGNTEIYGRFYDIPMDEWHTVSINVNFAQELVSFTINGRVYQQSLTANINGNTIDPSLFIEWLAERRIRLGAHYSEPGIEPPWHDEWAIIDGNNTTAVVADAQFDNLIIQSPKPPGDPALLKSSFTELTQHLEGTATLDELELEQLLVGIRANLEGSNFNEFSTEAKAFINAHSSTIGSLYIIGHRDSSDYKRYDDFSAVSKAYVDLGVWMMKHGLTPNTVSSAANITFPEHTYFPGKLPADAARVESGSADILAQYVLDPGYLMGGMKENPNDELTSYVYRPTGYYAPAGEAVTISVDPSLVNSGLHVRVGGQKENHMLIGSTNRFPVISVDYRIEAAEFDVINPLGGGIYILVPQGVDIGWINVEIDGAVRAPYFSTRTGHETSLSDWESIKQFPGLFAEFESDKFMITVQTSGVQDFTQPGLLLERWDNVMDIFQILHGRPLERVRAEAFMQDSASAVVGSYPGGYPITPGFWAEGPNGITDGYFSPFAVLNEGNWEENEGFSVMLHEMGHHHYGRFIEVGEQESFVNVPGAAVFNDLFNVDLDDSLKYAGYQRFSRSDAAIDWMVTHNFRNGNPIGFDPTTDYQPIETSYQARSYAKFLDLADIFGSWEAIGDIYERFYLQDLENGTPADTQVGVSHDEFLQQGSTALQCNLASLFHFWGIHPSTSVASELAVLPPCSGALERVLDYLDAAPRTNEDLRFFHTEKTDFHEDQLKFQIYDQLLPVFDQSHGQQIRTIGTEILKTYFNVEADAVPSTPTILSTSFNLDPDAPSDINFSWSESVDPEGHQLKYSWKLIVAGSEEVILSRSWVEGTSVDITGAELQTALQPYIDSVENLVLAQQVTTADIFTVVASEIVETNFTSLTDTDGDGIPNEEDDDDDNDGVLDIDDPFPLDPNESVDTDDDGIGNNADTDDDGDGVSDSEDAFPLDASESVDTDNDGIGNNADTDDDGDGVVDTNDAYPLDPTRSSSEPQSSDGGGGGGGGSIFWLALPLALLTMRKKGSSLLNRLPK